MSVSGCYHGINGGRDAAGGTISGCTFRGIADAAVRFDGSVNGDLVGGCTFGAPGAPCGTGIFVDAAIPPAHRKPLLVEDCAFAAVGTPIDENDGSHPVVKIGAGNTWL